MFGMTAAALLWSVLFGAIGAGYFMYGKKQRAPVPMLCGVALMVYPYFITSTNWLVLVGVALAAVPYFVRL